jgi:tetratricopeptide (TPR) repeat protein
MPPDKSRFEEIALADERDQTGYTRYLCELYLKDYPDHWPTLIRYAGSLISLGQYPAAQIALDQAQANVPEKYRHLVLSQRGHLLKAQGDFAGACELYLQAHKISPDDATYLIFAGSVAFDQGDIARAQALTRQATQCSEGSLDEAWFNLGGYLLSDRQYTEAADCYRRALAIDPDYQIAKDRLADVELIVQHKP